MAKYTSSSYFVNPAHESIAASRYYLKDSSGLPVEKNIFETFKRVNDYIFQNDPDHKDQIQRLCEEKKFMYAGRPLAQAGTNTKNMYNCYSKNVPIVTERGVFAINEVCVGDRVLTEDGTFQKVINKFEQGYRDTLLRIVVDRMPNVLEVTPDHKIMTRRGWVKAEKLTSEDYVSVPGYQDYQEVPLTISVLDYIKVEDLGESWVLEIVDGFIYRINDKHTSIFNNKYNAKVTPLRTEIPVNSELAKLLGYYISEGCSTSSGNTVLFTYHEAEKEYIQETCDLVKSLFGIEAHINSIKGQKCTQVQVNSRLINNFFRNWIGSSFDKKILPWWVLNTDIEFQRILLAYTCRGDAHVKSTGQALLTMCNPHTMMQLFFIAQKLGLAYSFKYGTKREERYATPVVLNIAHDRSQAGEFLEFSQLVERYVPDNRYWRKIKSVESVEYNDSVWDISVAVNHSLQIAGMVGSNCFVLGIGDSREEISECQRIHFHIQAHGGGTGINFSKLRPSGAWCKGANARSSGPEGFITAISAQSSNISQGGNRCLIAGSRVAMSNGLWKDIIDIKIGDSVLAFDKSLGRSIPALVYNIYDNGKQEIFRHVLNGGHILYSTSNHRWLGLATDDKFWIRSIEDMPIVRKNVGYVMELPVFGSGSSEWAGILGYLLGGGCITESQVSKLSVQNDEVREAFKKLLPTTIDRIREDIGNVYLYTHGKLENYLKSIGLYGKYAGEKFIPAEVFGYCEKDIINIVEGLIATDGSVNGEEIAFYSTSRRLVDDLRLLLLKFGIHGYILLDNRVCKVYPKEGINTLYTLQIKHPRFYNKFIKTFKVPGKWHNADFEKDDISVGHAFKEDIYFHGVKESKSAGIHPTYCIEIDHPDHLFIVDGAISHNSGANMGILEDWHPGLWKFITKKSRGNWENIREFSVITDESQFSQWQWSNPYQWQTFNVSVAVSDEFMRQVKHKLKKPWKLHWDKEEWALWDYDLELYEMQSDNTNVKTVIPITVCAPDEEIAFHEALNEVPFRNKNILKLTKKAYHLTAYEWFEKICINAWEDGCPGIFFIDRARKYHNGEYFNKLEATNPCAEEILPEWSVCCLSSIVLPEFINEDGSVSWNDLKDTVYIGVRALNHITELNSTGIDKIDDNALLERRIGLGTIGMAETLIQVALRTNQDIRYSNNLGREFSKKILKFIKHSAYEASIAMAKEIGPFPAFDYEKFKESKFVQQLLKERPDLDKDLKKYGIANVTVLTQPPTGTTGTITGYSSGCEPYFAMAYQRNSNVGIIIDGCPSFITWLEEKDINYADYKFNLKELRKHKRIPKVFEEAQDISWKNHLAMQAIFADQVDSSVSKTINLPNNATVENIMDAYIGAYDLGIKSTAVYRDGSKTQILEHFLSSKTIKENRPLKVVTMSAPSRPEDLPCDIHTVSVLGQKWKVLVGLLHGHPYETFCFPEDQIEISSNKTEGRLFRNEGGKYKLVVAHGDDELIIKDVASFLLSDEHRMITRLLSTSLRHGAPLAALVSQLTKCDGEVTTFSKALMRVLRKYITDEEFIAASICTQCRSKNLVNEDGCYKCADCGFTACG